MSSDPHRLQRVDNLKWSCPEQACTHRRLSDEIISPHSSRPGRTPQISAAIDGPTATGVLFLHLDRPAPIGATVTMPRRGLLSEAAPWHGVWRRRPRRADAPTRSGKNRQTDEPGSGSASFVLWSSQSSRLDPTGRNRTAAPLIATATIM